MKKLIISMILIAAMLAVMPAGKTKADDVGNITYLSSNVYYDYDTKTYAHIAEGISNAVVYSNVTDGMYTNEPVSLSVGVAFKLSVFRDGMDISDEDLSNLTTPGTYNVRLYSVDVPIQIMKFTIVGPTTDITDFRMPEGFVLSAVYHNDENIIEGNSGIKLTEEGEYIIEYACISNDMIYTFAANVDTTAPTLKLEAVKDGVAKGPVSLEDCEAGAKLTIMQDGVNYTPEGLKLTQTGHYLVRITDAAGNYTDYEFDIIAHLDAISIIFLILFFLMIAALIVYMVTQRRKMRVR